MRGLEADLLKIILYLRLDKSGRLSQINRSANALDLISCRRRNRKYNVQKIAMKTIADTLPIAIIKLFLLPWKKP